MSFVLDLPMAALLVVFMRQLTELQRRIAHAGLAQVASMHETHGIA